MTRANILNTGTTSYLELIGNGKTYRVPLYQRDYAWTQQEWEDLWNDVVEMRGDPEGRHYMGALVVQAQGDREFFVIDGQQRLATISVLALAIIDKLRCMAEAGTDEERNRERATELRNRFIGEKDPASLVESSRLRLNETDDPFYQDYLVQLRGSTAIPAACRSRTCSPVEVLSSYFSRQIDELFGSTHRTMQARRSRRSCRRPSPAACCSSSSRWTTSSNAYTLFETLNARGLELTATDLLRNYFFSKVRVAKRHRLR